MANSQQRRQKQLAKKKSKRKVVITAKKMVDKLGGLLSQSAIKNMPIFEFLAPKELFETGIGTVIITRKMPNKHIVASFFMLDVFCLGVKNAYFAEITLQSYRHRVREIEERKALQTITPACAKKLVEAAATYAKNLGFSAHSDYTKAKKIFAGIDVEACSEEFTFGKDGKPFYTRGPFDTFERSRKIINQLTKTCGPDNFHYLAELEKPLNEKELET
jgi:hypothetical protein